ncbi:MAG: tyrosine-type recombinase/integrase [Acidobacteria bacterium]|nr:tyrosine-type recombinase/integrase [Acidobacteriota bacterium]
MNKIWPDRELALLRRYVADLDLTGVRAGKPYESVLRRFQTFAMDHRPKRPLDQGTLQGWLRQCASESTLAMAVRRAQIVTRFLDWLVANGYLTVNPFSELRRTCRRQSTAAIVRALVSPDPDSALKSLRSLPRFGSHLGPVMREHVERMKTLGFRYDEARFRRFDEFLQQRTDASNESLAPLVEEYAKLASSPASYMERVKVGRLIARSLQRTDPMTPSVRRDSMIAREVLRQRRKPYIFTKEEVRRLLRAALEYPSPKASLRPISLYTMFVLAYCAGLRMAEIVGLHLSDIQENANTIDIRNTKFSKSRRLPVRPSTMAVISSYLLARCKVLAQTAPDSPLFWHRKGGYAYVTANHLMRRVMRRAGLKPDPGRQGPRIHDLRHTFVVHRMIEWYREGVDVQAKLPYLWTYLGHRDLHSSLVYITITQELLHRASERFRAFGAHLVTGSGGLYQNEQLSAESDSLVLSRLDGRAAERFTPHHPFLS